MSDPEKCEATCPKCGKPVAFEWDNGFVSSPDTVLVADWVFHANCYDDAVEEAPP